MDIEAGSMDLGDRLRLGAVTDSILMTTDLETFHFIDDITIEQSCAIKKFIQIVRAIILIDIEARRWIICISIVLAVSEFFCSIWDLVNLAKSKNEALDFISPLPESVDIVHILILLFEPIHHDHISVTRPSIGEKRRVMESCILVFSMHPKSSIEPMILVDRIICECDL